MAIDKNTLGALDLVREMFREQARGREVEKDRGLRIAELKIQSDEAELNRLGQLYRDKVARENKLRDRAIELGALSERFQGSGTDAAATAARQRDVDLGDRSVLLSEIESLDQGIENLEGSLLRFTGGGQAALEFFDEFKNTTKGEGFIDRSFVGPEELDDLIETARNAGYTVDEPFVAGLQNTLKQLGQQDIDNRFKLMQLEQVNLRASLRASAGQLETAVGGYIDDFRQLRDGALGVAEELGIDTKTFYIPKVDANVDSVKGAITMTGFHIAEIFDKSQPWGILGGYGGKVEEHVDAYRDAKSKNDIAGMTSASNSLYSLLISRPEEISQVSTGFSFSGLPGDEKRLESHIRSMVLGIQKLLSAQELLSGPGEIQDVVAAAADSITKDTGSEDPAGILAPQKSLTENIGNVLTTNLRPLSKEDKKKLEKRSKETAERVKKEQRKILSDIINETGLDKAIDLLGGPLFDFFDRRTDNTTDR